MISKVLYVLAVNNGSSSIKVALFEKGDSLKRIFYGKVECIGLSDCLSTVFDASSKKQEVFLPEIINHITATVWLINYLMEYLILLE